MSVTNDGATILKSVHMDNPAGKVLVEISKTQDDEVRPWLPSHHVNPETADLLIR